MLYPTPKFKLRYLSNLFLAATLFAASPVVAKTTLPLNMGSGLPQVVNLQAGKIKAGSFEEKIAKGYDQRAIKDQEGRYLVKIFLDGQVALPQLRKNIEAFGFKVQTQVASYRYGVIAVYVTAAKAAEVAQLPGVSSVSLQLKPMTNIGAVTSQGAAILGSTTLNSQGVLGTGITVGVLSNSYDASLLTTIRAANDVASGDLPGIGNPNGYTTPVVVLQDLPTSSDTTDEGRGMAQIIHDLAPGAKLCFASANFGETGFADNIRALADKTGPCKADIVVDDVIYFDEPFFSDGIVAQAVDDVFTQGVSYFSSAGNYSSTQVYDAPFRLVPASQFKTLGQAEGLKQLNSVPSQYYAGGVHDFDPGTGVQIAQTVLFNSAGTVTSFQWDDPFNAGNRRLIGPVKTIGSGTISTTTEVDSYPFAGTAGQKVYFKAQGGGASPLTDLILIVKDPQGNTLATIDTLSNPAGDTEEVYLQLPTTGTYTVSVDGFDTAVGDYTITSQQYTGNSGVTTDFDLLIFDTKGNYLGVIDNDNLATDTPSEVFSGLSGTYQIVLARKATPNPLATRLRYVVTDGGPQEFVGYTTPVTFGHNSAAGANGVAAYAYDSDFTGPFTPVIEGFTSPGPTTIYFDKDGNRLATPEQRQTPKFAAIDGTDTTFFPPAAVDPNADVDGNGFPNFFGTSAAAPHAAAVAALLLDAAGGPGSLTPGGVRKVLQATSQAHDLDPSFSQAKFVLGPVSYTVKASGDGSNFSSADPNFFEVSAQNPNGAVAISKITINLAPAGLVFDRPSTAPYITFGNLVGLSATDVTVKPLSDPSPTLTLVIKSGAFTSNDVLSFGIDRDVAATNSGGNSADLLAGATVTLTLSSSQVITIPFSNNFGTGYSLLDGFGLIDGVKAVDALP